MIKDTRVEDYEKLWLSLQRLQCWYGPFARWHCSSPTSRVPPGERWAYASSALNRPVQQTAPAPAALATFAVYRRCKTMPPGMDMKGYCLHCWAHVDLAEKLLCDKCYQTFKTFKAPHDSREMLTMCEACYESISGVLRERERMRASGIGYDEEF